MSREHTVNASQIHHDWDASRAPAVTVDSGDIVHFDLPITGEGQVTETLDGRRRRLGLRHDLQPCGPGPHRRRLPRRHAGDRDPRADPGPWGWTTIIPGLGLLAGRLPGAVPEDLRPPRRSDGDGRARCRGADRAVPRDDGSPQDEPGQPRRSLHTGAAGNIDNRHLSRDRRCGCRSGARARSSPAGMHTRPGRRGGLCQRRSSARCRRRSALHVRQAHDPRVRASRTPHAGRSPGALPGHHGDRRRPVEGARTLFGT